MPERPGGKPRSFGRGLLLTVVTLGIYALYWHYKAYKELEDAFPDRVDFPLGMYILCYVPYINLLTQILFMSNFISDVNKLRYERDLPRKVTLGSFLAWSILGLFIIVGPFVAYHKLQTSINDIWHEAHRAGHPSAEPAPSGSGTPGAAAAVGAPDEHGQHEAAHQTADAAASSSAEPALQPVDVTPDPDAQGDTEVEEPQPAQTATGPTASDSGESGKPTADDGGASVKGEDHVPEHYEPHACSSCGEETDVPPKRPLRLTCPACGTRQVLRNGS